MSSALGKKVVQISFDENNRIRLLDSEDFKATQSLGEECGLFVESEHQQRLLSVFHHLG